MILKFGKFKGQSVESLKLSGDGVSYLEWGARELRDEKMRKLFADTLAGMTDHERAMIMVREDYIGYDEAMTHIRDMRTMEAEDALDAERENRRQEEILNRWAAESGQSVVKLRGLSQRFMLDWDEQPASRFSSPAAHRMFRRYMSEIWK